MGKLTRSPMREQVARRPRPCAVEGSGQPGSERDQDCRELNPGRHKPEKDAFPRRRDEQQTKSLAAYSVPSNPTSCDWKGPFKQRFRWSRLRLEWGRWCYITPANPYSRHGMWWEWETK
jgi:hypothetical protein